MKELKTKIVLVAAFIIIATQATYAQSLRATELNGAKIKQILTSSLETPHIIEFRKGDEIPLNFGAQGDLFDSRNNSNNIITIKKDFFVKVISQSVFLSLDGENYKSLKETTTGTLSIGGNESLDLISVLLSVYLK